MDKILILGDIHGRTCWKDIISKEQPTKIIFLGDYVSSHGRVTAGTQISNLIEILDYKEANPDNVILLRGNHDLQHLGYYWAECSGFNHDVYKWMSDTKNKDRFEKNTQWIYIEGDYLFSHAGVSEEWLKYYNIKFEDINSLQPSVVFSFTPRKFSDYTGISDTQPCTWIRPIALTSCAYGNYHQVVGHTRIHGNISQLLDKNEYISLVKNSLQTLPINMDNGKQLYLCDMLPYVYAILQDGKINYKIYE